MIKIGQIGIGHNHGTGKMAAVRKRPDLFEVVGFSEDSPEWLDKRGGSNCYVGLNRMSTAELLEKCDAIIVECEVPYLTQTAQQCIDAGKHIHMDKPASGTLEDYAKLLRDAESRSLVVQLGYMYRYNPGIIKTMELIREGKLGEIFAINAEMSTFHPVEYKKWLTTFEGGIMYILGSHLIDLAVSILGEPLRTSSFLRHTNLDGVDFPDNNLAVLEYEKALARIFVSSVEVNGFGRRQLVVSGSKGTVSLLPIERKCHMTYSDLSITQKQYEDIKEVIDIADLAGDCRYDIMMEDFHDYIVGTKVNPYTYAHELLVQKVLLDVCSADHENYIKRNG